MSDPNIGVRYTEYARLAGGTPATSLWAYETHARPYNRPPVALTGDGSYEYWLDRSDPLLNTILPGTGISLIINLGDLWAAGRCLAMCRLLPRACVIGPVTQPQILRVGSCVLALGAGLGPTLAADVFGAPPSELVDRVVPLEDLWTRESVDRLVESLAGMERHRAVVALRDALAARIIRPDRDGLEQAALKQIQRHAGRVSVGAVARNHGLSRQQFARRFAAASGLQPKVFARITRFQALVQLLLATDVAEWASISSAAGFYDQAHMINEFHSFAGLAPTVFFRPHGDGVKADDVRVHGRPSEWLRRSESA